MIMRYLIGYKCTLRQQRGVAVVEFALILPILIVLFTAIIEFSRILYLSHTLEKSVRDASRYLASQTITTVGEPELSNERLEIARNLAFSGNPAGGEALVNGLQAENFVVSVENLGSVSGQRYYITVSVEYDYMPLISTIGGQGVLPQVIDLSFTMNTQSTMRAL